MTIQLSSLRVAPEFDASKYVAGANQKVAADQKMVGSNQAVAASAAAVDTRLEVNGDVLSRMSGRYVSGSREVQMFVRDLGSLNRALETGKMTMSGAEQVVIGMRQRLGLMADASELAAKGQHQLADAVQRANDQMAKQPHRQPTPANNNAARMGASMAGQQLWDVGITAAGGMSLSTIALQQGPQLGLALEQSLGDKSGKGALGVVKALGGGLMSLISPMNLLGIGAVVAGGALVQWFTKGAEEAKTLDDLLKEHRSNVNDLNELYKLTGRSAIDFGKDSSEAIEASVRRSTRALDEKTKYATAEMFRNGKLGSTYTNFDVEGMGPGGAAQEAETFEVASKFSAFNEQIQKLRAGAVDGRADWKSFLDEINAEVRDDPSLQEKRDDLLGLTEAASRAAEQVQKTRDAIGTPNGMLTSRSDAASMGEYSLYLQREKIAAERNLSRFEAERMTLNARSPLERVAAAKAQASAIYDNNEGDDARKQRIYLSGKMEQARIDKETADTAAARNYSLTEALAQQRQELDLIGKTGSEAAKLRFEFERMQELRAAAKNNGGLIDPAEVARIKEAADEMGRIADASARAKLRDDAKFERSLFGMSDLDKGIAQQLRGAGLEVDLNSYEAKLLRTNALLKEQSEFWKDARFEAEQMLRTPQEQAIAAKLRGTQFGMDGPEAQWMRDMNRFGEAKGMFTGFFSDFKSAMLENGGDLGDALGKSVLNAASRSMDKQWEQIFDQLGNVFASMLTGVNPGSPASMLGSPSFKATSTLTELLGYTGAANDNSLSGKIVRAPLAPLASLAGSGSTPGDVSSFLRSRAPGKALSHIEGLDPVFASRLASMMEDAPGNITMFSGYRSIEHQRRLWEASDKSGRWVARPGGSMHNFGNAADLGFNGGSFKSMPPDGQKWVHQNAANYGLKFPMAHEPWHIEKMETRGGSPWVPKANDAAKALEKLSTNSMTAGDSLGSLTKSFTDVLGKGGGSLTSMLSSPDFKPTASLTDILGYVPKGKPAAPAPAAGGGNMFSGIFSWLGSLFGFADGTEGAPPGWAWVGERGPELRKLRAGDVVRSNSRSMQMAREGGRGGATFAPAFHIDARGSSMSRAEFEQIASDASRRAVAAHRQNTVQGDYSAMQNQYMSEKG